MVKTGFISLFIAVLAVTNSSFATAGKSNSKDCATGTFPPDNDVTQSSVVDTTESVEDAYAPDASAAPTTYAPVTTTVAPTTARTPVMTAVTPTTAPTPEATTAAPTSAPTTDDGSQDDAPTQEPTTDDSLDVAPTQAPTADDGSADEAPAPPTSVLTITDDGSLSKSLDLRTGGKAFAGSAAAWTTQASDGLLKIVFESTDNKDVRVNILSGDNKKKIAEVPVKKGQTVTWTTPLADVQDKKLYLDRWRPGLFGLPGTGGGWLQLWVPQSSKGGHLELNAKINVS